MGRFYVLSLCFLLAKGASAVSTSDIAKSANDCEKQKTSAETECDKARQEAETSAKEALEKLQDAKASSLEGTIATLAANARSEADKLEGIKAKCKKLAVNATEKCVQSQKKINTYVQSLGGEVGTDGQIRVSGANTAAPNAETVANTVSAIKPSQDKVHTSYWSADSIHARTVPQIQQRIDQLRAEADGLDARRATVAASDPESEKTGRSSGGTTTAATERGSSEYLTAQQGQALGNALSGGARGAQVSSAGWAMASATNAVPPASNAAGTPVLTEGLGAHAEAAATAADTSEASGSGGTNSSLSTRGASSLPDLPPLPPSSALDGTPALRAAGADGANDNARGLPSGGVNSAAVVSAQTGRAAVLSGVSGGGGGGSGAGGSWWSQVKQGHLSEIFGRQDFGGTKKKGEAGVDLSAFLPQQKRGMASLTNLGIHGPNVNFFSKVNERYHSLKDSFDP